MSTPWILHRLYSLDPSSPGFSCRLRSLIQYDEREQYLTNLRGPQLARLVDFLDEALSAITADDDLSQRCLHKLQVICSHHVILPSSYIASGQIARVGDGPIALDAIADVWEGTYHNRKVFRKVLIRCLRAPLSDDQTLKKLFSKWAVTWKRLRHPSIVPFIGVTTDPLQIILEWPLNGTLTEFIQKNPGTNRVSLLLDIAEGLGYLHANNITHGNLKGPNILVGHDGHARLTNFEYPSIVREMNSVTRANEYTTAWAAPEILKGADTITREADVFAFGMAVMEVFTGGPPFGELTTPVITSKIINGCRPARPQEARELGLTDPVWEMTVRSWHQDPAQRPTMAEVVRLARECYRIAALWARITDISAKVFTDNLLPFCGTKDVISLGCTNKFLALVTTDEALWKRKLAVDYNFPVSETARTSGWKFIYQKLRNPRIFVWGEKDKGRLGLPQFPKTTLGCFPFPVELRLPGVRVVSLTTSGEACHALGSDGSVYVWGTLNAYSGWKGAGFANPGTTAWTPLRLQLPAPTRAISCGNIRVMTLDANSTVWSFETWGRPYRLVSPLLDCSSSETTPIQIQCDTSFSAVLMGSGDVYAWKARLSGYQEAMATFDQDESTRAIVPDGGTVIPCHTWEMNVNPVKLPIPPDLPDLPMTGLPEEERRKETRFIKIVAFNHGLVGLTNKGHVCLLKVQLYLRPAGGMSFGIWRYLPNFSEIGEVKKHRAFRTTTGSGGEERPPRVKLPSDTMLITHLSGHDGSFFACSSSMVLKGESDTTPETLPIIIPELQNRSIITVVCGNDHFGALTSSGKLLTWGSYSNGVLGLGDLEVNPRSPRVTVPSEVRFDHRLKARRRVERYCFATAASRNHAAALVFDLAGDEVSPEDLEQHFTTIVPRRSNNPNPRTQTTGDQEKCCLM